MIPFYSEDEDHAEWLETENERDVHLTPQGRAGQVSILFYGRDRPFPLFSKLKAECHFTSDSLPAERTPPDWL